MRTPTQNLSYIVWECVSNLCKIVLFSVSPQAFHHSQLHIYFDTQVSLNHSFHRGSKTTCISHFHDVFLLNTVHVMQCLNIY